MVYSSHIAAPISGERSTGKKNQNKEKYKLLKMKHCGHLRHTCQDFAKKSQGTPTLGCLASIPKCNPTPLQGILPFEGRKPASGGGANSPPGRKRSRIKQVPSLKFTHTGYLGEIKGFGSVVSAQGRIINRPLALLPVWEALRAAGLHKQ